MPLSDTCENIEARVTFVHHVCTTIAYTRLHILTQIDLLARPLGRLLELSIGENVLLTCIGEDGEPLVFGGSVRDVAVYGEDGRVEVELGDLV